MIRIVLLVLLFILIDGFLRGAVPTLAFYWQAELADRIGVSRQTINSIEANRYVPSTVLALKIGRVFSQPVEYIFQLDETD